MSNRIPKTSKEIRLELDVLNEQLSPLQRKQAMLERALREALSREAVIRDRIRLGDVVLSSGPGVPWFYRDDAFVAWIRSSGLTHKPWAEWNGSVYPMKEFLLGRLSYEGGVVRIEDVKEAGL